MATYKYMIICGTSVATDSGTQSHHRSIWYVMWSARIEDRKILSAWDGVRMGKIDGDKGKVDCAALRERRQMHISLSEALNP